jgi:hypothetical protein
MFVADHVAGVFGRFRIAPNLRRPARKRYRLRMTAAWRHTGERNATRTKALVDKSWGVPTGGTVDQRTNSLGGAQRPPDRLNAFEDRAQARAASREAAAQERERARDARREEEQAKRAEGMADRTPRRRRSGRTDVVRVQRDTSGYQTVKDVERMRELAKRGASVSGLAEAFGMSADEVERALID